MNPHTEPTPAPATANGPDFLDLNGRQVHAFATQMANLGFAHLTDLLMAMFHSGAWRTFHDGLGTYEFLPGEFDYFLTQQGVTRDDIMNGVRDIETKAKLEAAMDERKTGQLDYRRSFIDARAANPERPGRPIRPFGYTRTEASLLLSAGDDDVVTGAPRAREAMGAAVRRLTNSDGQTSRRPSEIAPRLVRVSRAALRLDDTELAKLAMLSTKNNEDDATEPSVTRRCRLSRSPRSCICARKLA